MTVFAFFFMWGARNLLGWAYVVVLAGWGVSCIFEV